MERRTNSDVAIILLNWNSYEDTFECLVSLESLTYRNFCVFLVDNDSHDDSFEKLQQDFHEKKFNVKINFIQTGSNLGFAGGNNVAIREAYKQGYKYFWLLNNDTTVDRNTLTPLVKSLEEDHQVGIVGSKIYYYGTNKLWFAGGRTNTFSGSTKHIGIKEEDKGQYDEEKVVDYITGCSLFFRDRLLETTGYMSEDYFLYFEETDWNIRAKRDGWLIKFIPESVVYHKISNSSKVGTEISPHVGYYDIRNAILMISRIPNNRRIRKFSSYAYGFIKLAKYILKAIINNESNKRYRLKVYFKGLIDGIQVKSGIL